jgi:flavorubredoxin
MTAQVTEIADGIFRLSVFVPEIAPPTGFSFNSFLVIDDDPLLFHAGQRSMFPLFRDAVASLMPVEQLRWISFGHIEADECGAMNLWLEAAPKAEVVHGETACNISLNDLADRPPRVVADGELTSHMPGSRGWYSRRPAERCFAAICSPSSAIRRRLNRILCPPLF